MIARSPGLLVVSLGRFFIGWQRFQGSLVFVVGFAPARLHRTPWGGIGWEPPPKPKARPPVRKDLN